MANNGFALPNELEQVAAPVMQFNGSTSNYAAKNKFSKLMEANILVSMDLERRNPLVNHEVFRMLKDKIT